MAFTHNLEKASLLFSRILLWIGGLILVVMILLTCANIFLRTVWFPVRGTFELMGYGGAVVTAFALAYTQIHRGHIAVDILVLGFSKRIRKVLNAMNHLILMAFFAVVTWQMAKYAKTLLSSGELTETLQIVYYPFTYAVALGCLVLALVFLTDFMKSLFHQEKEEP